jgi:polyisoprenyl-phosphate glycosyltransferase
LVTPPWLSVTVRDSRGGASKETRATMNEHKPAAPKISIVVPTYNEEETVPIFYGRIVTVLRKLGIDWEVIFSVDPSTDGTEKSIRDLCATDSRVRMLRFARRFGQPMATLAGLEASSGDAVVVIDCDLQDPPELIEEMVARWSDGYDVVYAQRRTRAGETLFKRFISSLGYRLIRRIAEVDIPPNTGDFRLLSRRVVNAVVSMPERQGFLRGLVAFVGFPQTSVMYDRDVRAGGRGKYNRFTGSLRIGLNGVVGFSRYPLQVISVLGILLATVAFALGLAYLSFKLAGAKFPVGNPTIVILISFFSGLQLLSLGVMGEYIGRMYDEVRNRPRYIVESRSGWAESDE